MVIVLFLISAIAFRFHISIFHIFLFSMCHPIILAYFCLFFLFRILVFCNFPSFLLYYFQFSNFSMFLFSHYVIKNSCLLWLFEKVIQIVQYGNCFLSHFHNFNSFPICVFSACPCFLFPFIQFSVIVKLSNFLFSNCPIL